MSTRFAANAVALATVPAPVPPVVVGEVVRVGVTAQVRLLRIATSQSGAFRRSTDAQVVR